MENKKIKILGKNSSASLENRSWRCDAEARTRGMKGQIFALDDTKRFVGTTGQVLRPTDMTKQGVYQLSWGRIFRMQAIRKQDSREQPARKLRAEIQPQR
jgi:hypothetical protein